VNINKHDDTNKEEACTIDGAVPPTLLNKAKFLGYVCIENSFGASTKPGLLKLGTKIKNNIKF
jgi:hypothetical protein